MSSTENSGTWAIDARLVKRYRAAPDRTQDALEDFALDVHLQTPGGVTVLFGTSGAGKSLTLNCIAGFVRPDEGRILINNQLYFDAATNVCVSPERRRCGYLFQDHALFPHMTVRDNLRFAATVAQNRPASGLQLHRRMTELLEAFELTELASRRPAQMSGGQKQRAALARILMTEPRLLLLDEPTRGLDARLRHSFYQLLQKTRLRLQVPVILVTHDLDECFELADFVCLMDRGRLLQSGTRDDVFSKPATADIARSLGVYNITPAVITALDPARNFSLIRALEGEIEGPYLPGHLIGDHGHLCVRASEVRLLAHTERASRNQLVLNVVSSTPSSRGLRVNLEHEIFVNVSEADFQPLRKSLRLRLEIPPSAVYFLDK